MSKAIVALEDAERLLTYTRSAERWIISDLTDQLRSALAGLFQVYVELGEDTNGARNAKELFGPWVGFDPATHIPELVAERRREWEKE